MDRDYIDMYLVIDRYLQGTLDESETARFEERLLWDQALIDELDIAERLRDGLRETIETGGYKGAAKRFNWSSLGDLLLVPQYAAAASFALAAVLVSGLFLSPIGPQGSGPALDPLVTELHRLLPTRGDRSVPIAVNEDAWTVLIVDVTGHHDSYRVEVRPDADDAEAFYREGGLVPTTYLSALTVGMPGTLLAPGEYVLSLDGEIVSGDDVTYEHIQDIGLRTVAAD